MWRSAGLAGALGLEIALDLVIGGGAGYFLDRKFNTHWIMYLGLFFGLGAAVKALMRVTKAYKRSIAQEDAADQRNNGGGGGARSN
jgi:F0F1-type ATP synthase assembly protein I